MTFRNKIGDIWKRMVRYTFVMLWFALGVGALSGRRAEWTLSTYIVMAIWYLIGAALAEEAREEQKPLDISALSLAILLSAFLVWLLSEGPLR